MNLTILEVSPYYPKLQRALQAHAKKAPLAELLVIINEIKEDFQELENSADRKTSEEIDQGLRAIIARVDRAILQNATLL